MLERQKSFDEILERLIILADASERQTEMTAHLALLSGRTTQLKTAGELLGRYARVLHEQGDAHNALAFGRQALDRAGDSVGPYLQQYLYLDLADALAAAGRNAEAERYWRDLTRGSPAGLSHRIAAARLAALRGQVAVEKGLLEEAIRRWQNDPSAGKLRRRALWTARIVSLVP